MAHRIYGRMAPEALLLPSTRAAAYLPASLDGAGPDAAARDRFAAALAAYDKQDGELQRRRDPTARHRGGGGGARARREQGCAHLVEPGRVLAQDRGRSSPTPPRHYDDRGERRRRERR